jgi:undecaprenyl pyrophosphate phosphatase UppP
MILIYLWICAQIILEMVPISSSSHLLMLQNFFKRSYKVDIEDFFAHKKIPLKTIYYFLHGPTLVVVFWYFAPQWFSFVFKNNTVNMQPLIWIGIADSITLIFYLCMQHTNPLSLIKKAVRLDRGPQARVERSSFAPSPSSGAPSTRTGKSYSLTSGFIITMLCLFYTAWCSGGKSILEWQYADAIILGCAQAIALLPGISRLAFTCAAGCWLGYSLPDAFCLSWLIQAPLMAVACAKSIKDLISTGKLSQVLNLRMGLVMLVSGMVSMALFMLVTYMVTTGTFFWWGWYMFLPIMFYVGMKK